MRSCSLRVRPCRELLDFTGHDSRVYSYWFMARDHILYLLACNSPSPPDDHWLSIAVTMRPPRRGVAPSNLGSSPSGDGAMPARLAMPEQSGTRLERSQRQMSALRHQSASRLMFLWVASTTPYVLLRSLVQRSLARPPSR